MCTIKWFTRCEGETVMALFDASDFIKLNAQYNITVYKSKKDIHRDSYVVYAGGQRAHRLVANCPTHLTVDHKNHEALDNRLSNLRVCTQRENNRAKRGSAKGTSQYKGVSITRRKAGKKNKIYQYWFTQITLETGKKKSALFKTEIEAARQYNEWAKQYYGEFAYLNELPE